MTKMRTETDSLGELQVPQDAYFGIQTQRAVENFPISGWKPCPIFVWATVAIKKAAALSNREAGVLDKNIGQAIVKAADEVLAGKHLDQFVVDVYQAGAGTSHNMNANEVLANRAAEILKQPKGQYKTVHPNDHVNMGQSTNDVIPTAMRIAALKHLQTFFPELDGLAQAFDKKAKEFHKVIKSGRTHLQDAVPVTLGQEFSGYAQAMHHASERIDESAEGLAHLGIGGSAAGTGLNTAPGYRNNMVKHLRAITGFELEGADNLFYAMQSMAPFASVSGELRNLALELIRIANDMRLLSSGPRTGFDEVRLPAVQPGSSIMPGKVNPVMAEMLDMVGFQVVGNDHTIAMATQAGQLELNVMMPLIAFNLLNSIRILKNAMKAFRERCIEGLAANVERCRDYAENTLGIATALNPSIGYRAAAEVVKESVKTGKKVRQIIEEKKLVSKDELNKILSPEVMANLEGTCSVGAGSRTKRSDVGG
jgi:aspartate ammonia-lyase